MQTNQDVREQIVHVVAERLGLDEPSRDELEDKGRLDEFTAVDSLFIVELVLMLEERFDIRFEPENIDAELISDLDRLTSLVVEARAVS